MIIFVDMHVGSYMLNKDIQQISVEKILNQKAPHAAKKIPRGIVRWLERLVCQKEINDILLRYHEFSGVDFMTHLIDYFGISLDVKGYENLPDKNQRVIFASNHPLGGLDGICLSAYLGEHYDHKIKYLVNDLLYFLKPLQPIFLPINKSKGQSRDYVTRIEDAYKSDDQIIIFPAGICSRKQNGKICDLDWHAHFVRQAIRYERIIVPIHFGGKNSKFFYNIANWRKRIGIKMNYEMILLPKEMFRNRGEKFTITFGKPIHWTYFDDRKNLDEWADWIKKEVYALK